VEVRGVEKVIKEFKIVETEDGYRIEVKGDKEKMKELFSGLGGRKFRGGHAHPFGFGLGHAFLSGMGPRCCWWEEETEGSE